MIDVSIIIVNYNTFNLTCQCIDSVIKRTDGIKYEVILVDNASSECEPARFKEKFPALRLIVSDKNLGFAGGNNLGIREATGELILLLNSDTVLKNNAIYLASKALREKVQAGVLSCKLLYEDGRAQPVGGRFPSLKRELRELFRLNRNLSKAQRVDLYLGDEFDYESEREVDWVWGAFFLFKKELLDGFPDKLLPADYFMYMEDVLWCYRIRQSGHSVWYHPAGEVYHLIGGSSPDSTLDQMANYQKKILPNEYDFILKMKGVWYAKAYYFIKAVHHLTLLSPQEFKKAKMLASLLIKW